MYCGFGVLCSVLNSFTLGAQKMSKSPLSKCGSICQILPGYTVSTPCLVNFLFFISLVVEEFFKHVQYHKSLEVAALVDL